MFTKVQIFEINQRDIEENLFSLFCSSTISLVFYHKNYGLKLRHLAADALKCHEVWKSHIDCLKITKQLNYNFTARWWRIIIFLVTFIEVSRMHTMLQKPRTKIGSCVSAIKIIIIFRISIGYKYHLHCPSTSPNCSNALVTAAPNSQSIRTDANDQKINTIGEINSVAVESCSD